MTVTNVGKDATPRSESSGKALQFLSLITQVQARCGVLGVFPSLEKEKLVSKMSSYF